MFGLELWFVLAALSALVGGLNAFLHKVVVEKDLDVYVVTFCTSAVTTVLLFGAVAIWGDWANLLHPMLLFAFLQGFLFSINLILKVEALRYIDSAIYFPIYKVLGPLMVILAGMVAFGERFTVLEWVGLVLSMVVPLLLITKAENRRQRNLTKGIIILIIGSLLATVAAVSVKQGMSIAADPTSFLAAGFAFMTLTSFMIMARKSQEPLRAYIMESFHKPGMTKTVLYGGVLGLLGIGAGQLALYYGGPLGIVYTINSLYILIPIVLSIIYYHEHWNLRKMVAIVLSIAALALLK